MPEKPLLIFDGDCNFCRRWIERWRLWTQDRVDYQPYQKVHHLFPEIKREQFERSVQLVESGRKITSGAQAVFRSLANSPHKRWPLWCYEKLPGFKIVSELFYALVASNRRLFSFLTRLFWGSDVMPSTYHFSSKLFLGLLGFVYASAFISLGVQILGLYGSQGIIPVQEYLPQIHTRLGAEAYFKVPTLFWFGVNDAWLQSVCWLGAALSLIYAIGFMRPVLGLVLWVFYLSLFSVGNTFLSFQWDILLLEAGFLAIFLPRFKWLQLPSQSGSYRPVVHWLFVWLIFRLMFSSGIVKLLSGDMTWRNLTALDFHYETQPLPTWIGYYAHQLPAWFQKASVISMFVIELVLPFFFFLPRRLKSFAALSTIFFQGLIILTGNYTYFNILTIALCVLLMDDHFWPSKWKQRLFENEMKENKAPPKWSRFVLTPILLSVFLLSVVQFTGSIRWHIAWPRFLVDYLGALRPLRLSSTYGLFTVMTTKRDEIVIEGSNDGKTWTPYEFKFKPGDPGKRPDFIIPHQPRLDWQMWFAALSDYRRNRWLVSFCIRLLEGSEPAVGLLANNPFPDKPPEYIRAAVYSYQFTDPATKKQTGHWWERKRQGLYLKTLSLR